MISATIDTQKRAARQQIKSLLEGLDPAALRTASAAACEHLCATPEFQKARTVMLFLSLPAEVDTSTALEQAWAAGKTVLTPYVVWETRQLLPLLLPGPDCELETDDWGLRFPKQRNPVAVNTIDLLVTPGLGFDAAGRRLGRGGGFYDRFLMSLGLRGASCGLALEQQVLETVPANDQDVPIGMLVTDRQVRRFKRTEAGQPT